MLLVFLVRWDCQVVSFTMQESQNIRQETASDSVLNILGAG